MLDRYKCISIFPDDIIAESNTPRFMQVSCVPLYVTSKPLWFALPNDVILSFLLYFVL